MNQPYNKIDHSHCWTEENPPCGLKGKHRCCLCNEPVPQADNHTTIENRTPTTLQSTQFSRVAKTVEEPWVAEFDREFFNGGGYFKEMYKYASGDHKVLTKEKKIKSFIQKTLEADRKERAAVVVERIREAQKPNDLLVEEQTGWRAGLERAIEIIKDVMK